MGRHSTYNEDMAGEICERIADGESLMAICAEEGMPAQRTVFQWLAANDLFAQRYARARETQADSHADKIDEIGAGVLAGKYDPQAARVAVDALKWSAGKRAPKKYGDKLALAGDGDAPLTVVVRRVTDA